MRRALRIFFLALFVLALLLGGTYAWAFRYRPDILVRLKLRAPDPENMDTEKNGSDEPDRIWKVRRGNMTIGVILKGTINARTNHKLSLAAPFATKLVRVVDENTRVKAGDVAAEFETTDLLLKIEDYRMNVEQIRKNLDIAREERRMLVSTNAADLRTAHDNVTAAEDNYKQYLQLEGPRDRDDKGLGVSDAEQALSDAETELTKLTTDFDSTVFATEEDETEAKRKVQAAQQKVEGLKTKLNSARLDRKLFKRHTYPNKLRDLRNRLAQARLTYRKEQVRTQSLLAQKDNSINREEISLRKNEEQLERHLSWVPMMKLIAPVDGLVTYGDPDAPFWRKPEVKVGMDGRRNQVIITIPDMSDVVVNAILPEVYRSRVEVGNTAFITPDAGNGRLRYSGKLESIASLPEKMDMWDESSPKIYRTVFTIDRQDASLLSGMSVQVEVVSRTLHNVIHVPVEAVFEENGTLFVYCKSFGAPEKRVIRIGETGGSSVEVLEGLEENEEVYLYRPFQSGKTGQEDKK
ncbi:MAG: hypothetical protein J5944_12740 [Lentisphaeria bacterium]|nr:hypothetical protein [Lentisphaeria bacterium]